MSNRTDKLLSLLDGQPVIPVLKIERAADAAPLARALARGGLKMIEITLRTNEALEAIRRAASEVEDAVVGAGTILSAAQFQEAAKAGSRFIVSPGITREVLAAGRDSDVPLLPARPIGFACASPPQPPYADAAQHRRRLQQSEPCYRIQLQHRTG